jgi:hypothetical protein
MIDGAILGFRARKAFPSQAAAGSGCDSSIYALVAFVSELDRAIQEAAGPPVMEI